MNDTLILELSSCPFIVYWLHTDCLGRALRRLIAYCVPIDCQVIAYSLSIDWYTHRIDCLLTAHVYCYGYTYIHIYIYVWREREREAMQAYPLAYCPLSVFFLFFWLSYVFNQTYVPTQTSSLPYPPQQSWKVIWTLCSHPFQNRKQCHSTHAPRQSWKGYFPLQITNPLPWPSSDHEPTLPDISSDDFSHYLFCPNVWRVVDSIDTHDIPISNVIDIWCTISYQLI